jgi:hypothetical protein
MIVEQDHHLLRDVFHPKKMDIAEIHHLHHRHHKDVFQHNTTIIAHTLHLHQPHVKLVVAHLHQAAQLEHVQDLVQMQIATLKNNLTCHTLQEEWQDKKEDL